MNKAKLIYAAAFLIATVTILPTLANAQIMPTVSSVSPNVIATGTGTIVITVNGSNYVNGSWVNINGNSRSTAYISPYQLTTTLSSSDVASSGTIFVSVSNPSWVSGSLETSNSATITVTSNPSQEMNITSISPSSAFVGSQTLAMTVNGYGFVGGASVSFNGLPLTTTYLSSTQLLATIPASYLSNVGLDVVRVTNPGGMTSGVIYFNVASRTVPGLPETGAGPNIQNGSQNGISNAGIVTTLGIMLVSVLFFGALVSTKKHFAK